MNERLKRYGKRWVVGSGLVWGTVFTIGLLVIAATHFGPTPESVMNVVESLAITLVLPYTGGFVAEKATEYRSSD